MEADVESAPLRGAMLECAFEDAFRELERELKVEERKTRGRGRQFMEEIEGFCVEREKQQRCTVCRGRVTELPLQGLTRLGRQDDSGPVNSDAVPLEGAVV